MSLDDYPIKERLATDRASQLAWLVREMGYSRDKKDLAGKALGYEEKRTRLGRSPDDNTSVFGFMSGYWKRFRIANTNLRELDAPVMISKSLQLEAKVVAGLSDKVAFSFWLEAQATDAEYDPEEMLNTSIRLISARADELERQYSPEELAVFNEAEFQDNPMGQAILALHASYERSPDDIAALRAIAVEGAATGILMWQSYATQLQDKGYDVTMPKPGPDGSGGNIVPWED